MGVGCGLHSCAHLADVQDCVQASRKGRHVENTCTRVLTAKHKCNNSLSRLDLHKYNSPPLVTGTSVTFVFFVFKLCYYFTRMEVVIKLVKL